MIRLSHAQQPIDATITIGGSKSESNRWLILQKLFPELGKIYNLSDAKDTIVLQNALNTEHTTGKTVDIGHAGTAMRFLTGYLATTIDTHVILTGSERMQQRPISPLVTALRTLGGEITYMREEGYPPIKIKGKEIFKNEVHIQADISSQYITALMLIGARFPQGLTIHFIGNLTSRPYVEMTMHQLDSIGIQVDWLQNGIQIYSTKRLNSPNVIVESDWSSASYWYSIVALSKQANIRLTSYKQASLQGDAAIADIYEKFFGVTTTFKNNSIVLSKTKDFILPDRITLDLNKTPDIAQTIAVTCVGLKVKAELSGLKTLKIKETDRLQALQNELSKLNISTIITEDSLDIISFNGTDKTAIIVTYDDHRMAMAFAPLALCQPLIIENPEVVEKSYPKFWKDLAAVGFKIQELS